MSVNDADQKSNEKEENKEAKTEKTDSKVNFIIWITFCLTKLNVNYKQVQTVSMSRIFALNKQEWYFILIGCFACTYI